MMILNQIFIIGNPTIIHENQNMMAKKPENTCQLDNSSGLKDNNVCYFYNLVSIKVTALQFLTTSLFTLYEMFIWI